MADYFQGIFYVISAAKHLPLLVRVFNILVHTMFDLLIQLQKSLQTSQS